MAFEWTHEATAELERLVVTEGKYYADAASILSTKYGARITKSACIGRAKRRGFAKDAFGAKANERARTRVAANKPKRVRVINNGFKKQAPPVGLPPGITNLPPDISDCAVSLIDAASGQCRWPLDESNHLMTVCGSPCEGSYCSRHQSIAYQPIALRKRDRALNAAEARSEAVIAVLIKAA